MASVRVARMSSLLMHTTPFASPASALPYVAGARSGSRSEKQAR